MHEFTKNLIDQIAKNEEFFNNNLTLIDSSTNWMEYVRLNQNHKEQLINAIDLLLSADGDISVSVLESDTNSYMLKAILVRLKAYEITDIRMLHRSAKSGELKQYLYNSFIDPTKPLDSTDRTVYINLEKVYGPKGLIRHTVYDYSLIQAALNALTQTMRH